MSDSMAPDNTWRSRKFGLTLLVLFLISAGAILAIYSSTFLGIYATFGGLILSAAGLYFTGNITESHLANKLQTAVKVKSLKVQKSNPKPNLDQNEGE